MKKIKSKLRENKGITLTALVVTIILLLILATITIRTITGDNGIIRKASEAVNTYKIAEAEEQDELEYLYGELNESTEIKISLEKIKEIIRNEIKENENIKLNAYPIGSIYISTENTNPSELFGGTWENYGQGRTLIGAGTGTDENDEAKIFEANTTGGEYNHKLTVAEMPSHSHGQLQFHWAAGSNGGGCYVGKGTGSDISAPTGGSESHNNIQPYIVTYMWKRIS